MARRSVFRAIDTAFAILFVLLITVCGLHVSTTADMRSDASSKAIQMTADVERFRSLDTRLSQSLDCLRNDSLDPGSKVAILDMELKQIEQDLNDLGRSGLAISGLTRLVEPYTHISQARSGLEARAPHDTETMLARGGELERALEAARFVVRNNITRLGEERLATAASLSGYRDRANTTAIFVAVAALLAFAPVRIMAGRAAAKPIKALKDATTALAQENWSPVTMESGTGDAVGELVSAFQTMADKLRESREGRAATFHRTLAALVQAIEAKDQYVANHSLNVSKLAEELARAAGLPDAEAKEVACGALLHDIGKIGMPDEIINKPGQLTPEEFGVIRGHPVIGDRIISPLDGADLFHAPVRHHHEWWDGDGYPDGLRGEDIPLSARIIKISDVFEALTSDRPYRSKLSVQDAVAIMRNEAGTALDPKLVDLFVSQVLPRLPEILPHLARGATPAKGDRARAEAVPAAAT